MLFECHRFTDTRVSITTLLHRASGSLNTSIRVPPLLVSTQIYPMLKETHPLLHYMLITPLETDGD